MNMDRVVGALAIACVVGAVMAQVAPEVYCCKYSYEYTDNPDGSPCGAGTTTVENCETSSSGTSASDPNALEEQFGIRNAQCFQYDIGTTGSWVNIPCLSDPPPGAEFVGELADGSCCYAVPGPFDPPIEVTVTDVPQVKVKKCSGGCDGGPA